MPRKRTAAPSTIKRLYVNALVEEGYEKAAAVKVVNTFEESFEETYIDALRADVDREVSFFQTLLWEGHSPKEAYDKAPTAIKDWDEDS